MRNAFKMYRRREELDHERSVKIYYTPEDLLALPDGKRLPSSMGRNSRRLTGHALKHDLITRTGESRSEAPST